MLIGLDIGGTKLLVGAATRDGHIVRRARADTPRALDEGLALLMHLAREVAASEPIETIGAACGGPLDWREGVVSPLHQPEWRDVPLKRIFGAEFNCPFRVEVDTDAAALAEIAFGGARSDRLLYITLSTGMGGGFIVDGEIYRGANGAHPEVGHQAIPFRLSNGALPLCECGTVGCAEALVSGNAIRRIYAKPAEELSEAKWGEVAFNFGQALRNCATMYAPDEIVVGGGVALGRGQRLIDDASRVMRDGLRLVPAPRVRLSALGYESALLGAVALAQRA